MLATLRPISAVPKFAVLLLAVGLSAQLLWYFNHPPHPPRAEYLPQPPSFQMLQLASLGEPIAFSKILLLYLQTFDVQPGVKASFRLLDYDRLKTWLDLTLQLDPQGQYPLFLASRVYGATGDVTKQQKMFDFVYRQFFIDPDRRWDSLAYAAVISKHHLHDLPLAHKYAQALREYATGKNIPGWVTQMDIFILEDMKEYESAITLLSALLNSGQITDPNELRLLQERKDKIEAKVMTTKPVNR